MDKSDFRKWGYQLHLLLFEIFEKNYDKNEIFGFHDESTGSDF